MRRYGILMLGLATLASGTLFTLTAQAGPTGPQRVIVVGDSNAALHAAVAHAGGRVGHDLGIIDAVSATMPDAAAVARLGNEPGITRVDMDAVAHAIGMPESAAGKKPGGGTPPPQPAETVPWGIAAIGAVGTGATGAGVKVAIIDTGIDPAHQDLGVAGGINYSSSKGGDPTVWADDNGHGTHVAGTVAARDNEIGVIGVAPDAALYAVKVLDRRGSGYYSDIIAGIQWAVANDMDVINMSLGGSADVQSLHDAVDAADAAGILVFAAAGNSGDEDPATNDVGYPAKYASAIAVAAIDSNYDVAYFSSDGAEVDIAAPGVNILSTVRGGGYQSGWNGTSMATPHGAGTGAQLKGAFPSADAACLRAAIEDTAVDLGDPGTDVFYGLGAVDVPAALAAAALCP